jgi:hypothetical protein
MLIWAGFSVQKLAQYVEKSFMFSTLVRGHTGVTAERKNGLLICARGIACGPIKRRGIEIEMRSKKVTVDGILFDSKTEADYYVFLRYQEKTGAISNLRCHPRYELIPAVITFRGKRQRAINYILDFDYIRDGRRVAVDVKGWAMEDAQLKRKLFQWKYPTIELQWVAKSLKWGHAGWIDYDDLQTLRRREKRKK